MINIVSNATFSEYSGYYPGDSTSTRISQYLSTAQQVVESYLGYKLVKAEYTEKHRMHWDSEAVLLNNLPVKSVSTFKVNDSVVSASDYTVKYYGIEYPLKSGDKYEVTYTAGYGTLTEGVWDFSDADPAIVSTILRIAALLHAESEGNIGFTGTNLGNSSRTFVNYTSYQKYLTPINGFRVYPV